MNQGQIAQLNTQVQKYFNIDLASLLSNAYPEAMTTDVVIGEYSVKEFLSTCNKVFNQFKEELGGGYAKALPYQYQFHNEFGGGDLGSDLANLLAHIENNQFLNAISYLSRLIHYQAVNGFWEKSKRRYFRVSEEALNSEKERIQLTSHQLEVMTRKLELLLNELSVAREDLASFTGGKKKELGEIESLLATARNQSSEITALHSSSTSTSEKINALLGSADEKKQEADELQKESRAELSKIRSALEKHLDTIEKQDSDFCDLKSSFEGKLEFVDEKHKHFVERNAYLDDLIGREVGASLFETFKQRKSELNSSIQFWKWSVPVAALASIIWILILFGWNHSDGQSWQVIFVNSFKALPALGLLLFSISQYTKERNFQEEYAFKSAVALTVNSYAEQLSNEENKDSLIMGSVSSIYKPPVVTKPSKSIDEKTLASTVKDLSEAVKSFSQNK